MAADSPLDLVLSRLQRFQLRKNGPERWRACCPAHEGTNPSALSIAAGENGTVLLHCWVGCEVEAVVHALGMELTDLFPQFDQHARPSTLGYLPTDAFDAARFEVGVVAVIAADMKNGREVSTADWQRLTVAARRLDDIARQAYAR